MNTTTSTQIFSPLDAANLESIGLLGPVETDGKRKCHKRRLNRSSDEEHKDIPLDVSIGSPEAEEADAYATIPDAIFSRETLNYLGFSTHMADTIWNGWVNWPLDGPGREVDAATGGLRVTFIDFIILRHVKKANNVYEDDDFKWRQCLNACGMSDSVQNAIMDENFKEIRMSRSCVYWVTDTVQMRYAGLKEIQRASRERDMQLQRERARQGGPSRRDRTSSSMGSDQSGSAQRRGHTRGSSSQGGRSFSGAQADSTPGIHSELWNPNIIRRAQVDPQTLILFKGIDLGRIPDLLNPDGTVQNIMALSSPPPSDFSNSTALFYFTPEMEVAEYYAAYAKRRAGCEAVVMVTCHIPKQVINDMKEPNIFRLYYPTPQWKQLVWRSRSNQPFTKPLRKYDDAMLIIGNISSGDNDNYRKLASWEEIDGSCLLRVKRMGQSNAQISRQYAFTGRLAGQDLLTENGKFNAYRFSDEHITALISRHRV
ncbi:uncharacterized protein G6M90_00g084360 [Metarhizium brunneum]|uniref:Uncharacterized protein n=1 Tax=Metarhizium brunneum TaxID=500148 RepID=A0A7D5YW05_9HYPO